MEKDLKILVVDDSVTDRQILGKIVSSFDNAELVGTAANGKIAIAKMGLLSPDLVLLDVIMPEFDGLQTLKQIKTLRPNVEVVMLSGIDKENAKYTVEALEYGALDFIAKPRGHSLEANVVELRSALSRLFSIARTRKYSRQVRGVSEMKPEILPTPKFDRMDEPAAPKISNKKKIQPEITIQESPRRSRKPGRIDVVAIGVSTGGPNALQEIIPKIPKDLPIPILTVQHMPSMFTASLASRLDSASYIRVVEAKQNDMIQNGVMYIAPGGLHMVVRHVPHQKEPMIGLVDSPPVNSCRPSVDVLFRSIAMIYGGYVLTVILTGMGNDGVAGVTAIRRKGGYSIVQDEKSSIIWGMPGAVVEANEANEIVPLDRIASRIVALVDGRFA